MNDTRHEGREQRLEAGMEYDVNELGRSRYEAEGNTEHTRDTEKTAIAGDESQTPEFPVLGPVLVIGGCGYVHIPALLHLHLCPNTPNFTPTTVFHIDKFNKFLASSGQISYTPSSLTQKVVPSPSCLARPSTIGTKGHLTSAATSAMKRVSASSSS